MTALCLAMLLGAPGHTYVALGDSFTAGTGASPAASFPSQLAARWKAPVVNLGVNGFTTDDLIAIELPRLPELHATFATLAIGANDIVRGADPEAYRRNLKVILAALARVGLSGPRLLVLPQPLWSHSPAAADFGSPTDLDAKIAQFNRILAEETALAGARFLDLSALMKREAEAHSIADDGLHPSAAAYLEWARAIAAALPQQP